MRYAITAMIALGLLLIASPIAWASTSNDEIEVHDPEGDAGPASVPLGPAAANVDILTVDLATQDGATTATMGLAAFDVRAPETFYGIAYVLDESSFVWLGYGKVVLPFHPYVVEGFYGCHLTEAGETCTELTGETREELPGFTVDVPGAWAPAGATLEHLMAATFHDPFLPHPAGQIWWETAWPHNVEDMAYSPDPYHVPEEDETASNQTTDEPVEANAASGTDEVMVAELGAGTLGLIGAGLAAIVGAAGALIRRR